MANVVLVLEDDTDLRGALLMTLEDEGYEAHGAVTGAQALELAQSHPFNVAIADVRLEGPDGIETLGVLKSRLPQLKCIVMTGYADAEAPARALRVQVDDYLYKPFRSRDLVSSLKRLERPPGYDDLFGRVLEGYRQLISRTGLANLELARHGAFRSFSVGVRSGQVRSGPGLRLWRLLERAELRREELAQADGAYAEDYDQLRRAYTSLEESIAALRHAPLAPCEETDPLFERLYAKVKSGALSLELLKAAPMLRLSDAVALSTDPELRALRDSVWLA